jgi:ribosomal protein S4
MKKVFIFKVVDGFFTLNGKKIDYPSMTVEEKAILSFHIKKQKQIYYGQR